MSTLWHPIVPLVTAAIFIGYLVIWRSWRFRSRYGRSPIHVPAWNDFSLHALLSRLLVLYFTALILLGATAAIRPVELERLDPLFAHRSPGLALAGLALVTLAGLLVRRAQEDMASSWRIGIDTGERTDLITGGAFQLCRNPIYLGLMLALFGFCLMIPGLIMGLLTGSAILLFQLQARLEEKYLLRIHGDVYSAYCSRVGRFLPWTGRGPTP